ncbi:MAG TPA: hypothetical protein VI932_08750 [Bacteroidota bacterium]|nr:hypothetical protein [Bacteroidota bacterium]
MKLTMSAILCALLGLCLLNPGSANAAGGDKQARQKVSTPTGTPVRTWLNINNISTVFKNTGISDIDVQEANSGFVFPKGSRKTAVFASGFLWGGKVGGEVRVGGSAYREGLQGGKILSPGVAESPDLAKNRIYRVRPDERPGSDYDANLSSEIADEGTSEDAIRTQYETDWTEWPAADGAPYTDVDDDQSYDPDVDIPGVPGADQTIWYVANDLNSSLTTNLYGSNPIGIEMQVTVWAYAQQGALGNMFFRKYVVINKSTTDIDSMYMSMWSDIDLGNSTDDYAGCDTTLSLGYVYNANAVDATYNPLPPPAVGFDFFQGPIVDAPGETGIFNGQVVTDKKNLPMTAFYYFARGDASVTDPTQGSYEGTTQFYNFFQGKIGRTGVYFEDPETHQSTTFSLAGDPQTRTGWLDGDLLPAGDRRIGLASGPFIMAAGDTQEVVVAEIAAGAIPGVDRISAIGLLKFYDLQAQLAYDNFFDLPTPPPAPEVTVTELDREIVLDWSKDNDQVVATENSFIKGYTFQGYNVYQLPSASASVAEGVRIQTFDINDGIGKIFDQVFDPNTGSVVSLPVQFGNDTYLQRFLSIGQDAIKQQPLINGIRYYYAVTAYSFNPDPLAVPNNLENPLRVIVVTPHTLNPGVSLGPGNGGTLGLTHSGTADGNVTVTVVDPEATTGDQYQVYFSQRGEIRDESGDWVPSSIIQSRNRARLGPDTLTGSTIDIAGVYGTVTGQLQLHCVLTIVSPDFDWADGITMTFPDGASILSAPSFTAGGGDIFPQVVGNEIRMGLIGHEYTGDGWFHGGEEWDIIVQAPLPLAVDWIVFDDAYGGAPIDAEGTTIVTTVGNISRTAKYWNLRNVTTSTVKLENQSVLNGQDVFPDRDDIATNPGLPSAPIVDGFQTSLNVNYAAPLTFFNISVNGASIPIAEGTAGAPGQRWTGSNFSITDYWYFGIDATSLGAVGYGSTSVNDLQQDYEFRWTGVEGDSVIGGQTVKVIKSGGSMATLYGARLFSIANHPLNPNPGSTAPFLVRVPFEVWNLDKGIQINYEFYDRAQANPAANGFYVWNPNARVYGQILDTPYDPAHIANGSTGGADGPFYTWNNVWYQSNWTVGDVVEWDYVNPIQIGIDTYNFTTTAPGYSTDLARDQVGQINVFPNPYYGVNTEELNKYQRFVTFTHLPARATIRIFNLAGVLVRTIEKSDPGQFQRWDLSNESGLPAASGFYVAYIDLPELGTTRVVKLAVIQERQILDRF